MFVCHEILHGDAADAAIFSELATALVRSHFLDADVNILGRYKQVQHLCHRFIINDICSWDKFTSRNVWVTRENDRKSANNPQVTELQFANVISRKRKNGLALT